ncbi:hypothetical protein CAP40_01500 [Sphingomonas sp. IBVSS2]|uniref:hypothetical protein n=1 Tax=Sphingomonas sp. IBVSS2 TaxID=1985172 RepID=UPI000A2ECC9A|nr:hypothetical protein [Sphingomonas sp. IBVSS2]OSZ69559.1 hypothetical protein CAP40_01500 [Sphingomonas sp. IBVSS2]
MSLSFRTITSGLLEWRGILISVTLERQRFVDHLQVETVEPVRAPLPITETGYRSHFVSKDVIEDPEAYVEQWLNHAAKDRGWIEHEADIRQYVLL